MEFEWTITVVGAVLCLLYGWCLNAIACFYRVRFSKVGSLVGMVGMVVLVGMAMVGPKNVADTKHSIAAELSITVSNANPSAKELRSIASQTMKRVGKRPSDNHIAYQDENGNLMWVTKSDYANLLN